jgi:O-antigen ligase
LWICRMPLSMVRRRCTSSNMIERMLRWMSFSSENGLRIIEDRKYFQRLLDWLAPLYAFLMGFVFFEPALAEGLVLLTVPLALVLFWRQRRMVLLLSGLYILPRLISVLMVMAGGIGLSQLPLRFLAIDGYLLWMFLLITAALMNRDDRADSLDRIMLAWALSAGVNLFFGLLAYGFGEDGVLAGVRLVRIGMRLEGFFKDPNVFASFLLVPLLYFYRAAIQADNRRDLFGRSLLVLILGITLILTFSRASWLGGAVGLLLISVESLFSQDAVRRRRTLVVVAAGVAAVALLLALDLPIPGSSYGFREYFFRRLGFEAYDQKRFAAWDEALRLGMNAPLAGISPGAFESRYFMSVHNSWLRFAVELGIVGIISHGFLAVLITWPLVRRLRERIFEFAALLSMGTAALFIDAFHWRHFIFLFALIFANTLYDARKRAEVAPA